MPQYEVTAVSTNVRSWDSQYGAMKSYRMHLKDGQGAETLNVEWSRKATSPAPAEGQQITGNLTNRGEPHGWQFKQEQNPMGGKPGGKDFKADPAKQAAIAMESAQKSAVEVLRLAMDQGVWKAPEERSVGAMAAQVKVIAAALFEQINDAAKAAG